MLFCGLEGIEVDPDMVFVDVVEFFVLEHIEFDTEDMVIEAAIIGAVQEAQVLSRVDAVDASIGYENENQAVTRNNVSVWSHGEDERGIERVNVGRVWSLCWDFGPVKSTTYGETCVVGEC